MFSLNDKVALVTGGSRGLGRAISVGLARAGARVAFSYGKDEASAGQTLQAIEEASGRPGCFYGGGYTGHLPRHT